MDRFPQEIDELRVSLESLSESAKRYHVLFEQSPYGVLLVDDKGRIAEFNEAAHIDLGYTRAEFEMLTLADIDPVEDIEEIRARIAKILRDGQADFYVQHKTKDGALRDVHVITRMITISGRAYSHAIWIDVTEQRRMERTLSDSEEKFRTLFDMADDGIMILSLDGTILDINTIAHERLGYSKEEMVGRGVSEIDAPEFVSGVPERIAKILADGKAIFEIAHVRKDGTKLPIEVNVRLTELGGEKVLLSIARDISERKRAEEALSESEKRFHVLFDQSPYGVLIVDDKGAIVEFNEAAHTDLGYTREEFAKLNIADIDPIESPEEIRARTEKIFRDGKADFYVKHKTRQGEHRDVHVIIQVITMAGRAFSHAIWVDVTDQMRMERTLRQSEDKFRTLFEGASDGIIIMSLDGRFLDMNTAAHERLGYTKQEMLGMHITDIDSPESAALVPERIAMIHAEGEATFEVGHVRKDGEVIPMEANVRVVEIGGELVLLSIARDITERKRAEHAIKRSESSLAASQRIAHIGSWDWDIETNKVHWSDEFYRIYGYQPGEVEPDYALVLNALRPESKEGFLLAIDDALKGVRPFELDYGFFRRDGSAAVMHTIGEVLRDSSGAPRRMVGTGQDVTEQRKAEDVLRDSEERFRAIFEYANDGILIADVSNRRFVAANRRICEMLGYTEDELLALGIEGIHPKEALPHVIEEFKKQVAGEKVVAPEIPVLRKDGTVFYADIGTAAFMYGGRHCSVGAFRDITERRRAEQRLRESEEKLRAIFDSVNDGIGIVDLSDRKFVTVNRAMCEMLGYTEGEFLALGIEEIHPKVTLPHVMEEFGKQARGEIIVAAGLPVLRKDGTVFYADVGTAPITLSGSQCLLGVFRDITQRKEAEEALRESEDRFQMAMRGANDGLFDWDLKTNEVYYSPRWKSMLGYAENELEGNLETWSRLIHPDDLAPTLVHVRDTVEGRTDTYRAEFRMRHKDGHYIDILARAYPVRGPGGETLRMVGTHVDITERKRMEAALSEVLDLNQKVTNESVAGIVAFRAESGECVLCNKALARITGGTVSQLMQGNFRELKSWRESGLYDAALKALASDEPVRQEIFIRTTYGHEAWMDSIFTKFTSSGEQHLLLIVDDITERKRMEDEIRETNRLLQTMIEAIPDMVFYRDAEGRYVMANKVTVDSMGQNLIGKTNYDFMPWDMAEMCNQSDEAAVMSGKPTHSEESFTGLDGGTVYLDTIKTCIYDDEGGFAGLLGISRDITGRKRMEDELRKTITERETLLRELYHRTKNNMNVIISLINLQVSSLKVDAKFVQMFRDLQNRIMSMALVHEMLYRSRDLSHVKLREYVEDLTKALLAAYKTRRDGVALRLDIGDFVLSIDTLVPCGLIINELMTNSLKYAFPEGVHGEIAITSSMSPDGEIELEYSDNGVGFPEGFDPHSTKTLGLKLIRGLMSSQLRGTVEISGDPGAVFSFRFREPDYQQRL